jgi:hypothetical protein
MVKPIRSLIAGGAGWALARSRPRSEIPASIMTAFAAVTAHSALQWAFVDNPRLDSVLGDPREKGEGLVVLIAAGEAVGLWLPLLLIPWAQMASRVAAVLFVLAAVTMAALYFYFPFDPVVISKELIASDGPPYLFAVFVCAPVAAVGYLIGWLGSQNRDL